jgi:hypothetical protein
MSNKGHHNDEGELHFEQIRHSEVQYEDRDLGARGIIVFLIVLGISGFLLCAIVWGYFDYHARHVREAVRIPNAQEVVTPTAEVKPPEETFPQPALQTDDVDEMNQLRSADKSRLNSYGWVDQSAGVAHIPIDQAMDQVLKQGIPARPAQPQQAPQGQTPVATFGSGDDTVAGVAGGVRPANNR